MATIEDRDFADRSDEFRSGSLGDIRGDRAAFGRILDLDADLDQFVRLERPVNFAGDPVGGARATDAHDGLQMVRKRFQVTSLF